MLRVRMIREESEWLELEPLWEPLLQQSANNTFFLSWAWLRAWWETYGDDYELLVLVAEDADRVCGIAPFAVSRDGQLEFMGTNAAWGEYLDLIVLRGREESISKAMLAHVISLADREPPLWRKVFFRFVRQDAPCLPFISREFASQGRELKIIESNPSPYATLPSRWSEYLAAHSANFRSWIVRNENRLARLGESRLLFAGVDIDRREAFGRMSALHADRWGRPFEPRFAEFHDRLSQYLLPLGRLVLALLEVRGEFIAARYDFAYAGKIWCYQGGWKRELASYRLGSVMLSRILQWAIARGFSEYDFLAGEAPYKRRWSNAARETVNLLWEPPSANDR